jgi:hypothetical protein
LPTGIKTLAEEIKESTLLPSARIFKSQTPPRPRGVEERQPVQRTVIDLADVRRGTLTFFRPQPR